MATLQETNALVTGLVARVGQLNLFVEELYKALNNMGLSAENQAIVDEIHGKILSVAAGVEDTFTENTPPQAAQPAP